MFFVILLWGILMSALSIALHSFPLSQFIYYHLESAVLYLYTLLPIVHLQIMITECPSLQCLSSNASVNMTLCFKKNSFPKHKGHNLTYSFYGKFNFNVCELPVKTSLEIW